MLDSYMVDKIVLDPEGTQNEIQEVGGGAPGSVSLVGHFQIYHHIAA